jgi:hypothetical protein
VTIAILTPSRGRPERLTELVESINVTAAGPIHLLVGLDKDDPKLRDYSPWYQTDKPCRVDLIVRSRRRLSAWTNQLARIAIHNGHTIIGSLGDDHRPRTPGWDQRITDALADLGSGLAYCADGIQDERLPTAPFWTADIIQALGWFSPEAMVHMYLDNYWLHLANDLGRRAYLADVLIEHMHHSVGKTQPDELSAINDAAMDRDRAAFERFARDQHQAILRRVRAALEA